MRKTLTTLTLLLAPLAAFAQETIDLNGVDVAAYVVTRGESLTTIARDWAPKGTTALYLTQLNQAVLGPAYVGKCEHLSEAFRNRTVMDRSVWERGGGTHFCSDAMGNENFPAWANSLMPGEIVYIPVKAGAVGGVSGEIARDVNMAVAAIEGERIALVVDTSGSMDSSDRAKVADLYGQLLGKRVTHVVSYSSVAAIVEVSSDTDILGMLRDPGDGGTEYVEKALRVAAKTGADAIVLIGDAGDNDLRAAYAGLPPVSTHCLWDELEVPCAKNFAEIAETTGGQAYGLVN